MSDFSTYLNESPEERRNRHAAMERRYAHLRDQPRPWVADPTKDTGKDK
jgi:hypothetical protein